MIDNASGKIYQAVADRSSVEWADKAQTGWHGLLPIDNSAVCFSGATAVRPWRKHDSRGTQRSTTIFP